MPLKLFIDTDIILDVVLNREPFYENSSSIFRKFENGEVILFTSASIIINTQYTGQKFIGYKHCRAAINYLLNYFLILEADIEVIKLAYKSDFIDMEDAIQFYTARNTEEIDYFITRNIKDFKKAAKPLIVATPTQFLKQNP